MDDTVFRQIVLGARLSVRGEDAATFLQGQFSNDLRRTETAPATYGLWLNHKGRVLADSQVLQRGRNNFEVLSRGSSAAVIRERLEAYIIADDVTLSECEVASALVIAGPDASAVVADLGLPVPAPRLYAHVDEVTIAPARIEAGPSWMVVAPPQELARWAGTLEVRGVRQAGPEELEGRRIAAGIPAIPDELGPEDLPNEGGLDHDAISYTKGCYLGQEVMARLHNLGQVRRRLVIVRGQSGSPLAARAPLFSGSQRAGEMRSAVTPQAGGAWIGLAMVSTHLVKLGATLSLSAESEPQVHVERLAEGRAP